LLGVHLALAPINKPGPPTGRRRYSRRLQLRQVGLGHGLASPHAGAQAL